MKLQRMTERRPDCHCCTVVGCNWIYEELHAQTKGSVAAFLTTIPRGEDTGTNLTTLVSMWESWTLVIPHLPSCIWRNSWPTSCLLSDGSYNSIWSQNYIQATKKLKNGKFWRSTYLGSICALGMNRDSESRRHGCACLLLIQSKAIMDYLQSLFKHRWCCLLTSTPRLSEHKR